MPEARYHRVSSQRFLPAFRLLAVALCATAFLLPAANAAKKEPAKKTLSGETKRKTASSTRTVVSKRSASASQTEKVVSGGRNVVASIRKKNGRTEVAVQRRSV